MLPILSAKHTTLHRHALELVISLALIGCGKTPDSTSTGPTPGNTATAGGSGNTAGSTNFVATSCKGSAQPGDTVSVPQSTFTMGCNASVDGECKDDEKPPHAVTLHAFEIDRNEVTQEDYVACIQAQACTPPSCTWDCTTANKPAGCVEFAQAKAYCAFAGKHLPTEAEWELAARGTDGRKFPWGNQAPDCSRVNMAGCVGGAEPVGSHASGASPYGALDMAGNMVEMIADWYDAKYYASSPANDPTGPATGNRYGGRGGGYKSEEPWQRTSSRDWYDLTDAGASLGFRCAR